MTSTATEREETPLARLIREQGRLKGWIAAQIGVSRDRITRLAAGEATLRPDEIVALARLFAVPVETFLPDGGTDE